jgi:L-aspartate oxidase
MSPDRSLISHLQSPASWRSEVAGLMREHAGLIRSTEGLAAALHSLEGFPNQARGSHPEAITAANAVLGARLVVAGALLRTESRGAHFRADFTSADMAWRGHLIFERGHRPQLVETIAEALEATYSAI